MLKASAHIIERVSGQSYGEFLQQQIFQPLGMTSTGHRADLLHVVPNLARGYAPLGVDGYREADPVDWTRNTGNGSLYSTAEDLAKHLSYQAAKDAYRIK